MVYTSTTVYSTAVPAPRPQVSLERPTQTIDRKPWTKREMGHILAALELLDGREPNWKDDNDSAPHQLQRLTRYLAHTQKQPPEQSQQQALHLMKRLAH